MFTKREKITLGLHIELEVGLYSTTLLGDYLGIITYGWSLNKYRVTTE